MGQSTRTKTIEIVVLIALAIIAQVIVGTLGQVTQVAGAALPVAGTSIAFSNSIPGNAINIVPTNGLAGAGLTVTLSGTYAISPSYPLTLTVTGNTVSAYATNVVYAVPGAKSTYTYTLTNTTSPQTLTSTATQFYNITSMTLSGVTAYDSPSITLLVTQTYNSVVHGAALTYLSNTITGTGVDTVTLSTANNNFNSAGSSVTTVLNFMSIIFLIAAVVILLSLFGLDKIFEIGRGGRGE